MFLLQTPQSITRPLSNISKVISKALRRNIKINCTGYEMEFYKINYKSRIMSKFDCYSDFNFFLKELKNILRYNLVLSIPTKCKHKPL